VGVAPSRAAAVPVRLGAWDLTAHADSDDDDDAPRDAGDALDAFFRDGVFTYAVDAPAAATFVLKSAGLRKYKPLQRLDALTESPRLRAAVPIAAPVDGTARPGAADTVRVRFTATFA